MQKLNIADIQKVATVLDANDVSLYDFKVNISYNTDLASLYFNDFKDGHTNDNVNLFFGKREIDYLIIFENEKVLNESYYKKSKLNRMNKEELYGLNYYHDLVWRNKTLLKSELIENLLSVNNEEFYKNHYEKEYYQDLDFDFATRGYSQGDYVKVKLVGNVEKWINEEYLTHLFYDTPISGIIEVFKNDVEELVHPAGTKMFYNKLQSENITIQLNSNISLEVFYEKDNRTKYIEEFAYDSAYYTSVDKPKDLIKTVYYDGTIKYDGLSGYADPNSFLI